MIISFLIIFLECSKFFNSLLPTPNDILDDVLFSYMRALEAIVIKKLKSTKLRLSGFEFQSNPLLDV